MLSTELQAFLASTLITAPSPYSKYYGLWMLIAVALFFLIVRWRFRRGKRRRGDVPGIPADPPRLGPCQDHAADRPVQDAGQLRTTALTRETWLLACLHWLAEIAWAYETDAPRTRFLLDPDRLPVPDNEAVLVTIAPEYLSRPQACLSILCHEGCHQILDGSCLGMQYCLPPDPHGGSIGEQVTDLAMFVVGFGRVFLRGYRVSPNARLGYLQPREYELAQKWVLTGRGIEDPGELAQFLRETYGIRRYPSIPGIPEYRRWVLANLLDLVHGDDLVADRLLKYEVRRNPKVGEISAIQKAIRRLLRDRERGR